MNQSKFRWEQRVRYYFPGIIWNLIPDYLYKYNKSQKLFQHYIIYNILYEAYRNVERDFEQYNSDESYLRDLWRKFSLDEKNTLRIILKIFLKTGGLKYTCELKYINTFDVLNLWYTKKVDDVIERDIKTFYDLYLLDSQDIYIDIIIVYSDTKFEIYGSGSNRLRYIVTYRDIFNLLLHIYCNGGYSIITEIEFD